jgi:hypothetical protein
MTTVPIRRALISVYDKAGLEDLARGLHAAGVAIVSTGSTAGVIAAAGVPVTEVASVTGFPECLDGRVKTLHPRIHAGILADRENPRHVEELDELGVELRGGLPRDGEDLGGEEGEDDPVLVRRPHGPVLAEEGGPC